MSGEVSQDALRFIAWSRIWSPVVSDAMREEAWSALELPGSFESTSSAYWSTFQVGASVPRVPLLLHAALGREAASVREDWMRVTSYLGLGWGDVHLPPDQLGAACEVYACAIDRREPMLIEELRSRYLIPWCQFASGALQDDSSGLSFLPARFEADLAALESHSSRNRPATSAAM